MKRTLLILSVFALTALQALYAQKTVTGVVFAQEDNEPLVGATILVKGTEIVTTSDIEGKFSIDVPAGMTVLEVKSLGMEPQEVDVSSVETVEVKLKPDLLKINQVVITALGIKKEEKALGYSAQQVGGNDLVNSGEVNVIQALSSKAAGIQITSSAGTPGASSKILLRGNATFTGENQPLIVVDGVPIDNSTDNTVGRDYPFNERLAGVNNSNRALDLNPDDIESVTVLKGPAAAALYGVRAGNGAIVITTKRGQVTDGAIKVSYGYNIDFSQVNKLPKFQHTYAQGSGGGEIDNDGNPVAEGAFVTADPGPDNVWFTADDVSDGTSAVWGPKISTLGITPVDNVDRFFQTGISHTHNLSLYGGGEAATFRLAFNRTDQEGMVPNTKYARTSIRLTTDARLSSKINIGGTANYINSGGLKAQNGSNLSGVALGLFRAPDSFDMLAGGGDNGYTKPNNITQHQYFLFYDNTYWTVYENPFTDNINRIMGNVYFRYKPVEWFDIDYRVGTDYYTDNRKQIFAYGSWDPVNAPDGQIEENSISYKELYSDLLLNFNRKFNDDLRGSLTIGGNLNDRFSKNVYARGRNFSIPQGYNNISNTTDLYADETKSRIRSSALFFDAGIEYKNMWFVQVTSRTEWSSSFGEEKNHFTFGSVNTSFVFSELIGQNNVFSFGKVRYAFAQSGINPPVYTNQTVLLSPIYTDGFTDGLSFPYLGQNGISNSSLNIIGNPSLKPERLNGHEAGVDLRFWKGRLNIDYTYYYQVSKDIILKQPIASSSGFKTIYNNAGEMVNKGHELVVSADVVRKKGVVWNVYMNFHRNRNEVTKLAEGVDQIDIESAFSTAGSFAIVGQPYGSFFGTSWYRHTDGQLIIDADGFPIENPLSTFVGNPYPDYQIGLGTVLSYKGFSVRALFDITQGLEAWCGTCGRLNLLGRSADSEARDRTYLVEGVQQTGSDPITGAPLSDGTPNTAELGARDYFTFYKGDLGALEEQMFDASWIRLRELGASYRYNLPKKVKTLRAIDFTFTARNVFLITDYPGVDPENSLTGAGSNIGGFDWFNMPNARSYNLGFRFHLN